MVPFGRVPRGGDVPGFGEEDVQLHMKLTCDVLHVIGARHDLKTNAALQKVRPADEAFALYALELAVENMQAADEGGHNGQGSVAKVFRYFQLVQKTRQDKQAVDEAVEKGLKGWCSGGMDTASEDEDSDQEGGSGSERGSRGRMVAAMSGSA